MMVHIVYYCKLLPLKNSCLNIDKITKFIKMLVFIILYRITRFVNIDTINHYEFKLFKGDEFFITANESLLNVVYHDVKGTKTTLMINGAIYSEGIDSEKYQMIDFGTAIGSILITAHIDSMIRLSTIVFDRKCIKNRYVSLVSNYNKGFVLNSGEVVCFWPVVALPSSFYLWINSQNSGSYMEFHQSGGEKLIFGGNNNYKAMFRRHYPYFLIQSLQSNASSIFNISYYSSPISRSFYPFVEQIFQPSSSTLSIYHNTEAYPPPSSNSRFSQSAEYFAVISLSCVLASVLLMVLILRVNTKSPAALGLDNSNSYSVATESGLMPLPICISASTQSK